MAVGLVALLPSAQRSTASAQTNGVPRRFLGLSDGRIYELSEDGATWQPRANFGKHCAITDVFERGGKVVATVEVQGHAFTIQSLDGRSKWYTLDRVPQKA